MPYNTTEKRRIYNQQYYQQHRDGLREYGKKYYSLHKDKINKRKRKYYAQHYQEAHERDLKRTHGTAKRYNEGMQKYNGECAFACDRKAYLVHHIDGKNIFNSPKEEVNNELTNLLPLCRICHTWLHQKNLQQGRNATTKKMINTEYR